MGKEFRKWDTNGSDSLEASEFERLMSKLINVNTKGNTGQKEAPSIPPARMQKFFSEVDTDGSGCVSFEEFVAWYAKYFVNPGLSPMEFYYKQLGSGWRRNYAEWLNKCREQQMDAD